jgi:hypothetical protein
MEPDFQYPPAAASFASRKPCRQIARAIRRISQADYVVRLLSHRPGSIALSRRARLPDRRMGRTLFWTVTKPIYQPGAANILQAPIKVYDRRSGGGFGERPACDPHGCRPHTNGRPVKWPRGRIYGANRAATHMFFKDGVMRWQDHRSFCESVNDGGRISHQ